MSDETLQDVAPEGQPTEEAVAEVPSAEPSFEAEAAAPEGQPAPRLYAGKYKSPEELEQSYLDSQREASRMAGELAAYKRATAQPTTSADPIASTIEKHEAERNKWQQYAERDDIPWNERARALSQVSRYDREIGKLEAQSQFQATSTRQSATQALEGRAEAVFKQYEQDLSPSSPLYLLAGRLYREAVSHGSPETSWTKAAAIRDAADELGIQRSRTIRSDRTELLGNLQKQAKAAVKNGAGTATVAKSGGITPKQIENMSDAEFAKYEREHVLGA